jgi:hypothetical protein
MVGKNQFEFKILRDLIGWNDDKIRAFSVPVNITFGDIAFFFFRTKIAEREQRG